MNQGLNNPDSFLGHRAIFIIVFSKIRKIKLDKNYYKFLLDEKINLKRQK
jgi:hypothetical protein